MGEQGTAVVIEDDEDVRNLLSAVLQQSGFEVYSGSTGREGVLAVRGNSPTVVTLDVGLPDIDGFEVLRRVRAFSDCYVIMLTARADELDTLMALQAGADDFLTKPFRPRELRARVAAMLRRPRASDTGNSSNQPPAAGPQQQAVLRHNGLVLHQETRTAKLFDTEISLTRSEFDLLHDLMRGAGSVRTKTELVRVVRGEHYREAAYVSDVDERAVEVHIGNLRRKLREDPRQPRWLVTVRGVGYRLAPERTD
ncbi:response regulator transcription factor [Arthrobacter sp. TMN-37]